MHSTFINKRRVVSAGTLALVGICLSVVLAHAEPEKKTEQKTEKFIALLKSSPVSIVNTAGTPQEEDVFTYGPDLIDQMQRKIDISYRHLPDHLKLKIFWERV